jgi:predicted ABC-type transport system involved in lysophospholipase L1 biosynthesis ATPase subunit
MSSAKPIIVGRDLRRSFMMGSRRIEVLRGIDLDILTGESVFLVGASGAGKTTLLYTLAGLERPESGTVTFEGRELYRGGEGADAQHRNRRIGFIFQGYFLLPELTAVENVMLPTWIRGAAVQQQAEEARSRVR